MVKCKICGKKSSPIIGDICVDCLADVWGDIVEMTPITPIKFIDLRDSDVEYNFAFFNIQTHRFITIYDRMAWYSSDDLRDSIVSHCHDFGQTSLNMMWQYSELCPKWVF